MEFIFGLEDIRLLAGQHCAGLPGGAAKERAEQLFRALGEMGGYRGMEAVKNTKQRPGTSLKRSGHQKPVLAQRLGA